MTLLKLSHYIVEAVSAYWIPCLFCPLDCKTAIEKENSRATQQRMTNKTLNKIGKTLKFDVPLVLNLARHSFATHLKPSGTPTSFITDALGHSSSKTTEHYLKTIPDQKYKEISDSLLSFN